jgi:hypothetical protein
MKKLLALALLLVPVGLLADTGDIPLSSNFQENSGRPLDAKVVAADSTARLALTATQVYDGMFVYQRSDKHTYQLQGSTFNWVDVTAGTSTLSGYFFPVSLSTGVTGTLQPSHLVSTVAYVGSSLGSGQCIQSDGNGNLASAGAPCGTGGGGGGGSPLETIFGTARSSPTLTIKANAPFTGSVSGSTNTLGLDGSSVTLQGNYFNLASIAGSTGTIQTSINNLGTSTGTLQTSVTNLGTSTGTLATAANLFLTSSATGTLKGYIDNLGTSTGTIQLTVSGHTTSINNLGTSTGTLQTSVTNLGTSTGTLLTSINNLGTSTGTIKQMIAGATYYIQQGNSLQVGATFYVSSGTAQNFYASNATVNGIVISSGSYAYFKAYSPIGSIAKLQASDSGPTVNIGSESNHDLVIQTNNTERARISNAGVMSIQNLGTNLNVCTDGSKNLTTSGCPSSGSGMIAGATYYIQQGETLQAGATFYVSSGTVAGNFYAGSLNALGPNGSLIIGQNARIGTATSAGSFGLRVGGDINADANLIVKSNVTISTFTASSGTISNSLSLPYITANSLLISTVGYVSGSKLDYYDDGIYRGIKIYDPLIGTTPIYYLSHYLGGEIKTLGQEYDFFLSTDSVNYEEASKFTVDGLLLYPHDKVNTKVWLYDSSNNNYIGLKSTGTVPASYDFSFPASGGTSGQYLESLGSGITTWATPAGGGGYALQPATVTIQGNQGVTASSMTIYTTVVSSQDLVVMSTNNVAVFAVSNSSVTAGDYLLVISSVAGGGGPNLMTVNTTGVVTLAPNLFANLGTPANGTYEYCSDCTVTTAATCTVNLLSSCVCAGSGTGAIAKRINGTWLCN